MGVRFPVGIGRAVRGVRGGCSLQFSDKLAMSSQKNQEKGRDTAMKRSACALWDGRCRPPYGRWRITWAGENAEGTGENAGRAPAFHACRKSAVLRPFDADRAARMDAPATIGAGRFSPGSGGENGKAATDRRDRSGRRFCAYSRTNVSVRHPKPSKGVWLSHYVRLHKVYINTVDTVSKTRKIYPLYTN